MIVSSIEKQSPLELKLRTCQQTPKNQDVFSCFC